MLKVSCAGDAGTQLILSSPVKGFSDNKRHSFHLQAASSPGDVAFSFITPVNLTTDKEQIMRLASRFGYTNQIAVTVR